MASASVEKKEPEKKEATILNQFAHILQEALNSRKPFTPAMVAQYEKAGRAACEKRAAVLGVAPSRVAPLIVSKTELGKGVANKGAQVAAIELAEQIERGKPNFSDWVNKQRVG